MTRDERIRAAAVILRDAIEQLDDSRASRISRLAATEGVSK